MQNYSWEHAVVMKSLLPSIKSLTEPADGRCAFGLIKVLL